MFGNCYVFNERNVKTNVTAPGSENGKLFIKAAMSQDTYELAVVLSGEHFPEVNNPKTKSIIFRHT